MCFYKIIGLFSFITFGYLSVYLFFFTTSDAEINNTVLISDKIENLNVFINKRDRAKSSLEITTQENELIFISKLQYPKYYNTEPVGKIIPNQPIEIRVRKEDLEEIGTKNERKIIEICSLSSQEINYITLSQYNKSHKKNRFIGRIVCPTLFLCSLYILFAFKNKAPKA